MKRLSQIPMSQDPSSPHADITNAPHLFGDPTGDADYGDADYGDADYGDVSPSGPLNPLAVFQESSGDVEEGDLHSAFSKVPKWAKLVGAAGLGAGAFLGTRAIVKAVQNKRAQTARLNAAIDKLTAQQTLRTQRAFRSSVPALPRNTMFPFFSLKGAKMNSSPIDPLSQFPTDMFKVMLDRQNTDTPFYQETAIGTFAAGTWTATATGVATNRFFTGLILQIGTNILNAAPGTVVNITATIPTIAGTLTIAANPFLLTYEKDFDVRFMLFPWNLVSNRPLPVLGQYSNAAPITVTVTGIPSASAVNLIVPGSLHPWSVTMRNALAK